MGMSTLDGFTPLESLLLFQSLAAYGTQQDVFTQISLKLKESVFLRETGNYSEERLSEESLKSRYLELLKDEAKQHLQTHLDLDGTAANGDDTKLPRKRRALSPKLSTLEDAAQHENHIPQLIVKLYNAYKEHTIREIREEERKYDELVAELRTAELNTSIDNGQQDTKLDVPDMIENDNVASQHIVLQQDQRHAGFEEKFDGDLVKPPASTEAEGETEPEVVRKPVSRPGTADGRPASRTSGAEVKISSILNPTLPDSETPRSPKRTADSAPAVPAKDVSQYAHVSPTSQRRAPPPLAPAIPPHLPPLQPNTPGYRHSAEAVHHSPYEPIPPRSSLAPSSGAPFPPQHAPRPPILPPPAGMTRPVPLPAGSWSPAQLSPETTQRQPPIPIASRQLPSPDQSRLQSLPFPEPDRPQPESWTTPQAYPNRQSQLQGAMYQQQQPFAQNIIPRGGGIMLPPFQVSPQVANDSNQNQLPRPSSGPPPPRVPPKHPSLGEARIVTITRGPSELKTPVSANQHTPMTRPSQLSHRSNGITYSPGSSTGWKGIPASRESVPYESIERPTWEVIPARAPSPEPQLSRLSSQAPSPSSVKKRPGKASKIATELEVTTPLVKALAVRGGRRQARATRATSKTPSLAGTSTRGRTRSESVASHADEASLASLANSRKIKNEPSTPAEQPEKTLSAPKTPVSAKQTARRSTATAIINKRKRAEPEAEREADQTATPRLPLPSLQEQQDALHLSYPLTVTAFRNFQKMTVPIMNNITSHKHASLFAAPVKERDAEGYSDIIRRPQDLKSIRAAIVAGSRAVVAATAEATGTGTPGTPRGGPGTPSGGGPGTPSGSSAGTTVTLPWSADLVPPRGIVNGAQLEQEVMRMFANAVMFNAGDDGVVKDTREMFESVESSIAAWRAAERNAAETRGSGGAGSGAKAEDETGAAGDELGEDEGAERSAKRRRV